MNTPSAFDLWKSRMHARQRALLHQRSSESSALSRASKQRNAARKATRATQTKSMMNMGAPKGHVALPRFPSERERVMFAAHESRKNAGWIRG